MYGYINGIVTLVTPKYIIVENNGIGYLIMVPNPYNYIPKEECRVHVYQHVREDAIELYGFKSLNEKDLFLKLISVSGIGPKTALSILASGSVVDICNAIESRNDAYLRKFPGIGTKASQQIILDLKGKISYESDNCDMPSSKQKDIEEALISLGYSKKEVEKVIKKLDMSLDEGELVKQALKLMIK